METKKKLQNFICITCDYKTSCKGNYDKHLLTATHLGSKKLQKTTTSKFFCETCNFHSIYKGNYDKHLTTSKHINLVSGDNFAVECIKINIFECSVCKKNYKNKSGLWKHQKKCINENNIITELIKEKELIKELIKQNQTILLENKEFKSLLVNLVEKPQNIINNTNCNNNNKQFNLQIFLNETCKNAMNMSDFIDSLVIKSNELEDFGKLGYVKGISNIFIRGLKELDETERPMHCTDKKRETLYIKENNVWEKENANREKMKKVIRDILHKNFKRIPKWIEDNPSSEDISSKKNMEYMHILNQIMTGISTDDESGINKIIKSVSCEVYLDKGL